VAKENAAARGAMVRCMSFSSVHCITVVSLRGCTVQHAARIADRNAECS
jgi:hypothetical protein